MAVRISLPCLLLIQAAAGSQLALRNALQPAVEPYQQSSPYGDPLAVDANCLTSGRMVSGTGRKQYCIDVPGAAGQKLVLSVRTARSMNQVVRIGDSVYLRQSANNSVEASVSTSTAVGPIIEVKPFQQPCERCDACPCIGCGHRCECSCNALCRLRREQNCAHTAGVLAPGRWFVGIDSPGDFTLRATLVAALALRAGEVLLPRTLWGASASQLRMDEAETEGKAFSDFFFYDPEPHEKMSLSLTLLRAGSAASWIDVYVRFGDWPTTEIHDARMRCDAHSQFSTFVLQADRLINERLCVLVVGRGDSWLMYTLATKTAISGRLLGVIALVGLVSVAVLAALLWLWANPAQRTDGSARKLDPTATLVHGAGGSGR